MLNYQRVFLLVHGHVSQGFLRLRPLHRGVRLLRKTRALRPGRGLGAASRWPLVAGRCPGEEDEHQNFGRLGGQRLLG